MSSPIVVWNEVAVVTGMGALVAMSFTPSEVTAITIAASALVAAVFTGVVNIIVALRRVDKKVDANTEKTGALIGEVQQVHTLTNSNLAAVTAKLETSTSEIKALRELVQDLKSEREKADHVKGKQK